MMPFAAMRLRKPSGGGGGGGAFYSAMMALNPLAYWRFAETSGTAFANSGSLGATANAGVDAGITLGRPSLVGDPSDRSVEFAASGRISVGVISALKIASDFTYLAVIVAPAAGAYRTIISYYNGGFQMRLDNSNRLAANKSYTANRGTGTTILTAGTKYLVAISVSSAGVPTFYVNGASDGTGITGADYGAPSGALAIGVQNFTENWLGGLDECAIFGTALSSGDHAALFAASGL